MPRVLDSALEFAARGLPVFPCDEQKRPCIPKTKTDQGGFTQASTDPRRVRELWRLHPGPLIGIPTGEVSGFDVLDLDLIKHPEILPWWHARKPRMPPTRVHQTRSGGEHWLFRHRDGQRNSTGFHPDRQKARMEGVDRRATGGYIIAWCAHGCPLLQSAPLALWPIWLADELDWKPSFHVPQSDANATDQAEKHRSRPYAIAALMKAANEVRTAGNGRRNSELNARTYCMQRFIAEGALSKGEVATVMAMAAQQAGLDARETINTIESALNAHWTPQAPA